MADIIFVNPPLSLQERYGDLSSAGNILPPIGLVYLAAQTRHNSFKTEIIDALGLNISYKTTVEQILDKNPKYIGLSAATFSIFHAAEIAEIIKNKNKNIKIIIGGCHITAEPVKTMEMFKSFDIGVSGEGEETIIELLNALENNLELENVKGLIIRDKVGVKMTGNRNFIKDLDKLPHPAWDLLPDLRIYRQSAHIFSKFPCGYLVTSRGCFGKCIFCDRSVFGHILRAHSAKYIIDEIKYLKQKYQIKDLAIYDDIFVGFRKRLVEFCDIMIKEKIDVSWSCSARIDTIKDLNLLRLMKSAGCWELALGIESGSQEILNALKKNIKIEQIIKVVELVDKAGIRVRGLFMIGNPLETKYTIRKTINFAKELKLHDFQMSSFTPLPGTEIYKIADKYGEFNNDWHKMNLWTTVFVPHNLTKQDIDLYSKRAVVEFYFRPKIIFSYIIMIINYPKHLWTLWRGLRAFILLSFRSLNLIKRK